MLIQVLLGLVGAVLVGAVLLVLGFRGKRLNDHPVCGWCRFDLSGVYPGAVTCPECGAGLKRANAVRIGQRRRRPIALALGLVMVVIPTLGLGAGLFTMLAGEDLNAYKPVALLLWEGRHGGAATSKAAAVQLVDRMSNAKLSADQTANVVEAALDIQENPRRPWATEWGDLIERARLDGVLSDAQQARFRNQAALLEFSVRSRVRVGEPVPIVISLKEARIGSGTALHSMVMLGSAAVNGERAQLAKARDNGGMFAASSGPHLGWLQMNGSTAAWGMPATGRAQVVLNLPQNVSPGPGSVTLVLAVDTRAQSPNMVVHWTNTPDWKSPTVRRHEATLSFDVETGEGPGVELTAPEPLKERVESILRPTMTHVYGSGPWGGEHVMQHFSTDGLPVGVAFDVFWRQGEREQRVGSFTSGESAESWSGFYPGQDRARQVNGQVSGLERKPVDVILRPSPAAAARTTDVFKIYNGEIVFKGVDVTWQDESGVVTTPSGGVVGAVLRGLLGR